MSNGENAMKKFGIIFFELTFIILLFACTPGTTGLKTYAVEENKLSVAWDPVPKPTNIPEGAEIRYCVYICKSESNDSKSKDKEGAVPVKQSVKNTEFKADTPIADTRCSIEFPHTGTFFIGVQSVVYEKEKTVVCDKAIKNLNRSDIAWSDKEIYTNYNPFLIKYGGR
jgi:hypothetical protein